MNLLPPLIEILRLLKSTRSFGLNIC